MSAVAFPAPTKHPQPRPTRGRARLRVVQSRRHTARYITLMVLVSAAGVFGIVSMSALAAESAFSGRALEREITDLQFQYEELTAEVAALESPARIREVVTAELGMVVPEDAAFLLGERPLSGDRRVRVSGGDMPVPEHDGQALLSDPLKPTLGSRG